MASPFSMRSLLRALPTTTPRPTTSLPRLPNPTRPLHRALSTTAPLAARMQKKAKPVKGSVRNKQADKLLAARIAQRKKKAAAEAKVPPKASALMSFLYAPTQTPPPLRMGRNRKLRHWTMHRAWQLLQRRKAEALDRELMQMQQTMAHACEVLRNLEGPGTRPAGWLYRKSMEKVGLWGMQAVPIEYARPMVETPGAQPWNHDWKRVEG